MDVLATITAVSEAVVKIINLVWGEQTLSEAALVRDAEEAARRKHEALAQLQRAREEGRSDDVVQYLSAVNGWDARLKHLRAQADAQRSRS